MPNDNPAITISVVIATYNRAHYLPDALNSLFAQTRPPDEVIVVDDGSSDDTATVVARYAPAVRYFYQHNQGRGAAFNFALGESACSHFCFFDDDDLMLENGLATHVAVLTADPDADYSYSPNLTYDENANTTIADASTWGRPQHCQIARPETLFVRTLEWGDRFLTYMQGMLVPGRCLREIGLFDAALLRGQDYDVMLKLAYRYRGVSTRIPTFVMRNHQGRRGPAVERHSASQRMAMWAKYDRQIILPYREKLALSAYLPGCVGGAPTDGDDALDAAQTVSALLERSRIMFSHGLFEQGLEDIERIGREHELTRGQFEELRAVVRHTANIEKSHYLRAAPRMARAIAKHYFPWDAKRLILADTLRGLYWSSLRFSRDRQVFNTVVLVYAMMLLTPRRLKLVA